MRPREVSVKGQGKYQMKAEGITVMCLSGCETSVPPACCTNSAGENVLPWQTQTMLTSELVYLYKKPLTVFPFGPFPLVETHGICGSAVGGGVIFLLRDWGLGGFPVMSILVSINELGLGFSVVEMDSSNWSDSKPGLASSLSSWWSMLLVWWEQQLCTSEELHLLSFGFEPSFCFCSGEEWLEGVLVSLLPSPEKKKENF